MNESDKDALNKLWERLGLKGPAPRGYNADATILAKELAELEAACMCMRCQSLREVKLDIDNPEKSAARAAQAWRWWIVETKVDGKTVGACFAEARDSSEAIYKSLVARISPGGQEFYVHELRKGFVPFGRWTGKALTPEQWDELQTTKPEQIGVQLDE